MATRFYLPASTSSTPISPNPDAGWEDTSFLGRAMTRTTKISDAMTTVAIDDSSNADRDVIFRQYVSLPLEAGQTITGSQALKAQVRGIETGTGNNVSLAIGIRVIAANGTTVQKTVLAVTRDATEFSATTLTNRQFTATSAATNYTTVAGDRLVIEVGVGGDPTGSSHHDSSLRLGDAAASDLAEDDTATTDDNPWVELTDTLAFVFTGSLAATIKAATFSGTATFAPGTKTATLSATAPPTAASLTGTVVNPTYTGVLGGTVSPITASFIATFSAGTKTATLAATVGVATFTGSATFAVSGGSFPAGAPSGFNKRKPILYGAAIPGNDLTAFPLLIKIIGDADIGAELSSRKFAVTEADGETEVPYGHYNDFDVVGDECTFTLRALFDLDSDASEDDVIGYLYYDDSATDQSDRAGLADGAGYAGFWPLEEDPSGSAPQMIDWTSNDNDGTTVGSMTSGDLVSAAVVHGLDLDGSDDGVSIENVPSTQARTYECIIKLNSTSGNKTFIANGAGDFALGLRLGVIVGWITGGSLVVSSGITASTDTWYYCAITFDGVDQWSIYVNDNTATNSSSQTLPTTDLRLGYGWPGESLPGIIDECRVTASVRSADWIAFTYENEFNNATTVTLGAEEVNEISQELVSERIRIISRVTRRGGSIFYSSPVVIQSAQEPEVETYTGTLTATIGAVTFSADATFAAGTKTATLAATTAPTNFDASATFSAGTKTAILDATTGITTFSADATFSAGTKTATLSATVGITTFSGTATFSAGTKTAILSATVGATTASLTGTFTAPVYDGELNATTGIVTFSGTATFAVETYTGVLAATVGITAFSGTATFSAGTKTAVLTATVGITTFSASGTFTAGTKTAVLSATTAPTTFDASATFSPGTKTATLTATVGITTFSGSATFVVPTYTGAIAAVIGPATFAGTAVFATVVFQASMSATTGPTAFSGSATFVVPTYTGNLSATIKAPTFSGTATHAGPASTGILSATTGATTASFSATFTVPVYTGTLAATIKAATAAFSGTFVPPTYTGNLSASIAPTTFVGAASFSAVTRTGTITATAGAATFSGTATFVVPVYSGVLALVVGPATFSGTVYTVIIPGQPPLRFSCRSRPGLRWSVRRGQLRWSVGTSRRCRYAMVV